MGAVTLARFLSLAPEADAGASGLQIIFPRRKGPASVKGNDFRSQGFRHGVPSPFVGRRLDVDARQVNADFLSPELALQGPCRRAGLRMLRIAVLAVLFGDRQHHWLARILHW